MRTALVLIALMLTPALVSAQQATGNPAIEGLTTDTRTHVRESDKYARAPDDVAELLRYIIYAASGEMTPAQAEALTKLANKKGTHFGWVQTDGTKQFAFIFGLLEYQQVLAIRELRANTESLENENRQLKATVAALCYLVGEKIRPIECTALINPKQ